jgi:hypothetical protein
MHLEYRVGEKLLNFLLAQGVAKYQQGRVREKLECYALPIQQIIQQQILGKAQRPKQWQVPLSNDKKEIPNDHIYGNPLDVETHTMWNEAISHYTTAMKILQKHSNNTDEDIKEFQDNTDEFFVCYIKLAGVDGITNYIHMLASGHIKYYMTIHHNL